MRNNKQGAENQISKQLRRPRSAQSKRRRRKVKVSKWSWWKKLTGLCVIILAFIMLWRSFVDNPTFDTKEISQSTSDTPIYILAVGLDDQPMPNADALVVLSMNREQQYATLISLLPETNIGTGDEDTVQLLGNVYRSGGIQALKEKVESTLHIFIPYYVVMRMPTAAKWLDKRGKVDFYVEKDLYREGENGTEVNLRQGFQELRGGDAVSYLRYREDGFSSLARVQRQQRFIKAFTEKLRHHYTLENYLYTYWYWSPDETNISADDAAKTVCFLTNLSPENWHYYITPGHYVRTEIEGYWRLDSIGVQNIIGLTLRPDIAGR